MFISYQEKAEIFKRLNDAEKQLEVKNEYDKHIEDKIDNLISTFATHDINEMKKYDDINKSLKYLFRFLYLSSGFIIAIQFLTSIGVLKLQ